MSTKVTGAAGRRKAGDVRREAMLAGRDLLVSGGPDALTLKAVGAVLGMSHANLIHHFGSAEAFQIDLKTFMVDELTRTVTALVESGDHGDVSKLVDFVFDAYTDGGIGVLMAWSALGGARPGSLDAVGELVAVLKPQIVGSDREQRARAVICLVTALALADSLIGKGLAAVADGDRRTMRDLTVALAERLRDAPLPLRSS